MTSIYHRRFYPDDVAATVAYVAPQSFAPGDARYQDFLANVGDANCRERLHAFQRMALTRREEIVPIVRAEAEANLLRPEPPVRFFRSRRR